MKTLIILLALSLFTGTARGQKYNAVYVITTSISEPNQTGVRKLVSDDSGNPLYKSNTIHYFMRRQDKKAEILFGHFDYNLQELAKKREILPGDRMEIISKPKSFLGTIHPVDLDEMLRTKSNQEIWDWSNQIRMDRRPIYLIDRNDFTADSIKLIEVDMSNNAPDNHLIE